MARAPRRMFVVILKKTNGKNEEKASRSAYDYLYHPILKLYPLWEIVALKPDFTAVSRTYDMHRLALLIRSCAMSICLFVF